MSKRLGSLAVCCMPPW